MYTQPYFPTLSDERRKEGAAQLLHPSEISLGDPEQTLPTPILTLQERALGSPILETRAYSYGYAR